MTFDRGYVHMVLEDVLLDFNPDGYAEDPQIDGYIDQLAKAFGVTS